MEDVIHKEAKKIDEAHTESPRSACMDTRRGIILYGYGKIVVDIVLVCLLVAPHYDILFRLSENVGFYLPPLIVISLMSSLLIIDVVYHAMLVAGLHKENVKHLKIYCQYTKVLWGVTSILGAALTIASLIGITRVITISRRDLQDRLITQMIFMVITIIFQTFMMLKIGSEINRLENVKNSGISSKRRFLSTEIIFTYKTADTKKVTENNTNTATEEIHAACEKTKLPV